MDAPFGTDQNCKIRRSVAGLDSVLGSLKQLHSVIHKSAHKTLIEKESVWLSEIGTYL